jgi:tRNA A37 methylthiotransferase MiaB
MEKSKDDKMTVAEQRLVEQLRTLPDEALERLQYLQPQVGCFNSCSFCSQEAGKDIWQMTKGGLS